MQDIDFDEIDRAVHSLKKSDVPVQGAVRPAQMTVPASEPVVVEPVAVIEVTPVAAPTIAEATVVERSSLQSPASPAVRRSSGRFMDVVHPSSDMRPEVPARVEPVVVAPQKQEGAERQQQVVAVEPTAEKTSAFHWPDPIDLSAAGIVAPTTAETVVIPDAPAVLVVDSPIDEVDHAPLESPFLAGTKIEKRPLGAFSGADADLPLLEDPLPFSTDENAEASPEMLELVDNEEVPEELHESLLGLDAHEAVEHQDELLLEAQNPPDAVADTAATDWVTSTAYVAPEPVMAGPTSIPQQYTELPTAIPEQTGSIFDTEAYHQPLARPAKKHSGALVIVWIVALILVGGGIGVGVYFFLLPMLG